MGKRLIQQARGRGGPRYVAPSHRYKGVSKHVYHENGVVLTGKIVDLIKCPGHTGPLAKVVYENEKTSLMIAPEGRRVGDMIQVGEEVELKHGNSLQLKYIPEGTLIYNIEHMPGDGGKFVRASGGFARIIANMKQQVVVLLPSKKEKKFNGLCKATVGVVAGGGRTEKPILKAGKRHHMMKAKNKLYPKVSGVAMNAVDHPFGGSSSAVKGKPTQSSRSAPPGRKVGKIAPSRTGRTKR